MKLENYYIAAPGLSPPLNWTLRSPSFNFPFDDVNLRKDESYFFHLALTGYTGDETSHIAWRQGWPDPIYRTGLDADYEELHVSPYSIAFITDEL